MADSGAPKTSIVFQQTGLGGVLRQYRLQVPPNQREYSWTDREVTTLLQDLAKAIADQESEYFLGTIVTVVRSAEVLEVVDGQQRLATTAILLAQIKNYLTTREPIIAESINGFLTDIDREKRDYVPKLQLNLDDNEYFRAMITAGPKDTRPAPSKPSHELIQSAFQEVEKQIRKVVAPFDPKDHGDALNGWLRFIEHGAQVILLKVPTDVNAYKMFETLNDRGLKTSQADLVKNYLFGQAAARLPEAQQKWAMMRGTLESLDEDDITITFLRHALIATRGYLREPDVYETVQSQARGPQPAVAFLNTLEGLAVNYVALFNPEHEKWNGYPDIIRRSIRTLNLLNIKPLRPLMLAIASKFSEGEAAQAFQRLISWGVRLLIVGTTRSGSVEVPLATAARRVINGELEAADALKADLAPVIPTDDQFRQFFEVATSSKASLARYYLRALEMTAKSEPTPWFVPNDDRETINLEHVLPLEPEGNWNQFDAGAVRTLAKRLGNMALLLAKQNSTLRSANFATKQPVYQNSGYELTRQIATVDDWTPSAIAARQQKLAELAVRTWPL